MASVGYLRPSMIQQNFPGAPKFTEKDIPDLSDRVYIVTGANTGVGKELTQILYAANGTVYLACRSKGKAQKAIEEIKAAAPGSRGRLAFLPLDLSDLSTVKPAVEAFKETEDKLDVLFNNAGVMIPPEDKKTAQGYDMQLGTNCLGPFLFTNLLTPTLRQTAALRPRGSVRVVWVASMAAELYSVKYGIDMSNLKGKDYIRKQDPMTLYGNSKAGNYLHSFEYARQHKNDDIISVGFFLRMSMQMFTKIMLHPRIYGAYTELFAGLSPNVTVERTGQWIGPWGRFFNIRKDIAVGAKPTSEGGLGVAKQFWDWTIAQVTPFI
ncbi:short chain dehydrogenase reductase [Grosmannia clavigera kw1407]|uniref:Short chain dehydrogenase reductase n=1 Tax=Grosmannia clavigera (strain kw1407 / UAMH 11150) TaxID=655863 RepID=F0XH27_GROCL|nr:short chain dehydrogenase reductase [Grosmannia clavigera kw1407]EFX02980.1 short chain dehydrogenase reductase [Grosmannia clavigera kw1407]